MNPMWHVPFLAVPISDALTIINPEIPYMTQIGRGLTVGNNITIRGRLTSTARNVAINLNKGWDRYNGTILLHFNLRFHETQNIVVINTKDPGEGWSNEVRPSLFPFRKERNFKIEILCEGTHFIISVDGKFYCNFQYRHPLSDANVLHIVEAGGIEIFSIVASKNINVIQN